MSWLQRFTSRAEEPTEMEEMDSAMKQALGDFKASVHAWSDAAYSSPRMVRNAVVHRTWRLAAGWSIAAVLLAGTLSGGLYEQHRRAVEAQVAAAQEAAHQRELAAQRAQQQAQQEDDILASVDKDISREVPNAMEPLAALTDESSTNGN